MFNYPNNSFLHVLRIVALRISKILSANNSFLFILTIIIYLKLYNSLTNLFIILNILIDMNYKILTTEECDAIWDHNVLQWLFGDNKKKKQDLINKILS